MTSRSAGRARLAVVWNGTRFVMAPAAVAAGRSATVQVSGSADYAVLARARHRREPGGTSGATTALQAPRLAGGYLAAALLMPAGTPAPGLGVLIPARPGASSPGSAALAPS
jgi:hypothetical protein